MDEALRLFVKIKKRKDLTERNGGVTKAFRRATTDESYDLSRFTQLELLRGARDETREFEKVGRIRLFSAVM